MNQMRNRNFMSASRTIEVSQPYELGKPKKINGIRSILSVTNKSSVQSISLNIDNETIADDEIISNHFNKFFNSVAGNLVKKYPKQLKPLIHP